MPDENNRAKTRWQIEAEIIERAARRADWERFRTVSTTMASGAVYFDPAQSNPVPKKPIEIPILTFPKRRINLKDVA